MNSSEYKKGGEPLPNRFLLSQKQVDFLNTVDNVRAEFLEGT